MSQTIELTTFSYSLPLPFPPSLPFHSLPLLTSLFIPSSAPPPPSSLGRERVDMSKQSPVYCLASALPLFHKPATLYPALPCQQSIFSVPSLPCSPPFALTPTLVHTLSYPAFLHDLLPISLLPSLPSPTLLLPYHAFLHYPAPRPLSSSSVNSAPSHISCLSCLSKLPLTFLPCPHALLNPLPLPYPVLPLSLLLYTLPASSTSPASSLSLCRCPTPQLANPSDSLLRIGPSIDFHPSKDAFKPFPDVVNGISFYRR